MIWIFLKSHIEVIFQTQMSTFKLESQKIGARCVLGYHLVSLFTGKEREARSVKQLCYGHMQFPRSSKFYKSFYKSSYQSSVHYLIQHKENGVRRSRVTDKIAKCYEVTCFCFVDTPSFVSQRQTSRGNQIVGLWNSKFNMLF